MFGAIVVGYDGSEQALEALRWAAQEAQWEHRPLHLVHVGLGSGGDLSLEEGTEHARRLAPDVETTSSLALRDDAAGALVEESTGARLLVVGARGLGGFAGLLLGSVSTAVAAHARCPVVVVRHRPAPTAGPGGRPVVVGVDGSGTSARAVDFAFERAARSGASLWAVHAWQMPASLGPTPVWTPRDLQDRLDSEQALLAAGLSGQSAHHPDVEVRATTDLGGAAEVLLQASEGAELLVVGSRGRGGFRGLLLGSVSQAVLHHATCPVAVVRPTAESGVA